MKKNEDLYSVQMDGISFSSASGEAISGHQHKCMNELMQRVINDITDELIELGFDRGTIKFQINLMVRP